MTDFENRHMIEALRSGVPSRSVGKFFSSSRKEIMDKAASLIADASNGLSNSMVIKGKYGEGAADDGKRTPDGESSEGGSAKISSVSDQSSFPF